MAWCGNTQPKPVQYALTEKPHIDRFQDHGLFSDHTIKDIQNESDLVNSTMPPDDRFDLSPPTEKYPQYIWSCTDRSSLIASVFGKLLEQYDLLPPWNAPANYEGAVLFVMPKCGTMKLTPPRLD